MGAKQISETPIPEIYEKRNYMSKSLELLIIFSNMYYSGIGQLAQASFQDSNAWYKSWKRFTVGRCQPCIR